MPDAAADLFGSIFETRERQEQAKAASAPQNEIADEKSIAPPGGYNAGPSSTPPAPPAASSRRYSTPPKAKREVDRNASFEGGADASAYLAKLQTLARELEAEARGAASLGKLRMLRQRLREWVEDLRSVGGFDALAEAVDQLTQKLGDALAAADIATQVAAVATQIAVLAAGGPVPPRPSGRPAFWK